MRSPARRSSLSQAATSSRFSNDSRALSRADAGSPQAPGFPRSSSSSSARLSLAGRSKVLLELQNPVQQLLGVELGIGQRHLFSVAPLVLLARATPARVVAADLNVARLRRRARRHANRRRVALGRR